MKIGVIGGGVVGHATARCFIEHVDEVCVYDVIKERRTHPLDEVLNCDLVFVCLPTPMRKDGKGCDVSAVEGFFRDLPNSHGCGDRSANFILRSTVPVGTTRRLAKEQGLTNLVHSPEFLTARCAVTDAQLPARNIVGLPDRPVVCGDYLLNLYDRRFPGVSIYQMSSDESEAVKLFQNSFFAVKVAYWNECRAYADQLGLDWDRLLWAVLADGRIAHSHTKVPGPDGLYGFGGSCLPGYFQAGVRNNGSVTLEELKNRLDLGEELWVESTDAICSELCYKKILGVTSRPFSGEAVILEVNGRELVCTPDHLMPISRGGKLLVVRAEEITAEDELIQR